MDDLGAGFAAEIAPSSVGSNRDYYIKVADFSELDLGTTYTIQVNNSFFFPDVDY